jgi:hypothetical protein
MATRKTRNSSMRHAGSVACSVSTLFLTLFLGVVSLGSPGCGKSTPTPTVEEIKGSRLNRLVNEHVQKQIEADEQAKAKGKPRSRTKSK